jgi:NDP-sugar pyrophosphorylase family protein
MIRESFGDGSQLGVSIRYSFDGPELLGTAGAIRKALPLLGGDFFVLYGDSYLPIDFLPVAQAYRDSGCAALMTVFRNEGKWDASNVWFEDGTVRCYDKKAALPQMHHIDYGLSVWSRSAFSDPGTQSIADMADLFRLQADQGRLAGYEVSERFYEIGSHSGLQELDCLFRNLDPQNSL